MSIQIEAEPLTYTPAECALALRCSRSKVYELISKGAIPSVRIGGGSVRVPREALQVWLRQNTTGAATA